MTPAAISPASVHGSEPDLVGQLCGAFVCQGFGEGSKVYNTASLAFMQFAGVWHRFVIDTPDVFWRREPLDAGPTDPGQPWTYLQADVAAEAGIKGERLTAVRGSYYPTDERTEYEFVFGSHATIRLVGTHDGTSYHVI